MVITLKSHLLILDLGNTQPKFLWVSGHHSKVTLKTFFVRNDN